MKKLLLLAMLAAIVCAIGGCPLEPGAPHASPDGGTPRELVGGLYVSSSGGAGATPGGSTNDIQINSGGSFGSLTPGAGVATWLTAPSSANLASAVTGETGTGALVFGTSPTLATATNTGAFTAGGLVQTGTTSSNATGTTNDLPLGGNFRIRLTNATGPTITGFSASGVADGTILWVYAAAATVSFTHEDVGSAAANRITLAGGTTINLSQGTVTMFMYLTDGTNSRWRHIAGTAI